MRSRRGSPLMYYRMAMRPLSFLRRRGLGFLVMLSIHKSLLFQ